MSVSRIFGWIGCCGLWLASWATEDAIGLEDALRLAMQQNPALQALRHELRAAQRQVGSASRPAPMLAIVAPALTHGGSSEELLLQQPLELNGARAARTRMAQAEQAITQAQALITLNQLLAEVAAAYYEAFYRERIAQSARESLQNAERIYALVRQQVEAGARAGIDLVQAEIELERVRQHARLREAEAQNARTRLNALIGLSPEASKPTLQVPPTVQEEPLPDASPPEIAYEQALARLDEAMLRQIRAEGIPDLGVQMRLERWRGERTRPAFGLSIQLPFLDHGSRRQQLRAQQERLNAQRLRLQQTQNLITAEQHRALRMLATDRARSDAYRTRILPHAEQLAQSARVGLETGQLSMLQVLEAERTVRTVREEAFQAEMELGVAWAEMQRVYGVFTQRFGKELTGGDKK